MPLLKRYVPLSVALKLQDGVKGELDLSEMRQVRGDMQTSYTRRVDVFLRLVSHGIHGVTVSSSYRRQVSVLFINLQGLILGADQHGCYKQAQGVGQQAMLKVQSAVHSMEGQARLLPLITPALGANRAMHSTACPTRSPELSQVNKMLIDDKGTVLLCVFGLPPRPHADDPLRAVKLGLLLKKMMSGEGDNPLRACVGVGSGRAFCGVVGSDERREFTTMGDVVNLSARLMGLASKPDASHRVLVDKATHAETSALINYFDVGLTKMKGKQHKLPVFAPLQAKEKKKTGSSI
eukprot:2220218-Prymnesium_polylepis.1